MRPIRILSRRAGVPWWAFTPFALTGVIAVVLGVGVLGAVGGPATTAAATETPGTCTITNPAKGKTSAGDVRLTAEQMQNAQTIVAVGKGLNAPTPALAVALAVSYQDTRLTASATAANGIAAGLFLETADLYPGVDRTDPAAAAAAFLTRLLALPTFIDQQRLGVVAATMQTTTISTPDQYQAHEPWATALATTPINGTTPPTTASSTGPDIVGTAIDSEVSCNGGAGDGTVFDPGNIISDTVFYNARSMTAAQIRGFLDQQGAGCPADNPWCVRNLRLDATAQPADPYCAAYPGGTGRDAADIITAVSTACGINPQVMLTTLQKESQGLTRTDPTASSWDSAWGWGCPDTGPGGTANCATTDRGFATQVYRMAHQWAKYRVEIPHHEYNYAVGTYRILYNIAETGCGGADVTITNVATASLYVYTPYQPNAASLEAYPGEGDRCSSYGNRNFFYLFRSYFGPTGGGKPAIPGIAGPIQVTGTTITLPANAGVAGSVTAPTPTVATVITAGLEYLGEDYSWGGGSPAGPTTGTCTNGVAHNACHTVGFDCSGLMLYIWAQVGINLPRYSQDQLNTGAHHPWAQALPGDLIGYTGHVALYIGIINNTPYMLEAPYTGSHVRVTPVRPGHYSTVTRLWAAR